MAVTFETGQGVRWRGRRWRVVAEEANGLLTLAGIDAVNRDQIATPLVALEGDRLAADTLPPLTLDVASTDRARWRALHQAFRTAMAGGREQLVGLDWGAVAVEPYQLVPLMRVARSIRPRLLVADDTGLGKTAEAGIILRWLAQRHQAGRVLIVTRAAPEPGRWQSEMWTKFGFRFDILRSGSDFGERRRANPNVNLFAQQPRLIVSMTLAATQLVLDELRRCPTAFDVVIVDEAHHLAERGSGTKRLALLGRALAAKCPDGALFLLSAVPHDGKTESFLSLLRLLDPLVESTPGEVPVDVASRLVVRRLKSEVILAGGRRFAPPKIEVVSTLPDASRSERALDRPLDEYLQWLSAEEARYSGVGARQKAQGCQFLATLYRKRFGSSVAALRATLRRRLGLPPASEDADAAVPYVDTDASDPEDEIIDPAAALTTPPPELVSPEVALARTLLQAAQAVPEGRDAKLQALVRLLNGPLTGQKVVVFTEYRDTLRAAGRRLNSEGVTFVSFHGDTPDPERRTALSSFLHDPSIRVFLATDAASEGQNLQRGAHHLVHLDVPWNPNRYVQRNGRIDRYGQEHRPHIWALVAADRRRGKGRPEYRALEVVVEKLEAIRREVGSVSPVLPTNSVNVAAVLARARTDADRQMEDLLAEHEDETAGLDISRLTLRNRAEIDEAQRYVERLGTTDDFESSVGGLMQSAFRGWDDGGQVSPIGQDGVVSVDVPARLRHQVGCARIERATFRRSVALADIGDDGSGDSERTPEFLSPAHPLVEATVRHLREEASDPAFRHRFDVQVGTPEGLVCSFAVRFVDGDGRTLEEDLTAVEVSLDATPSQDATADLRRLGLDAQAANSARPDPASIDRWQAAYPSLAEAAKGEATRRATARQAELVEVGLDLQSQEVEVLALWHSEQATRVDRLIFGTARQITLEESVLHTEEMRKLDAEHAARRAALRDRSTVRLASVEPIGGRLIVKARP
jgi:superfamily II DNA or RNA helicase